MRVAICISGGFRNCKSLYNNFQKYLFNSPLYTADIFISSWKMQIPPTKPGPPDLSSIEEIIDLYQPKLFSYREYDSDTRSELYISSGMKDFQSYALHNPGVPRYEGRWKKHSTCQICKQNGYYSDKCRVCGGFNVHNHIGMLKNVEIANSLKTKYENKNNFVYDAVIRTRFDNIYYQSLTTNNLNMVQDSWLIPEGDDDFIEYGGGCNDQFAISSSKLMDEYSDIYNHMAEFAFQNYPSHGGYGIPHYSIDNQARRKNIKITRFPFKYALYKRVQERGWNIP